MIITQLCGGLGNQMFQYAAGLSLAERLGTVLKLDAGWYKLRPDFAPHNRYALSCLNVTEQFATQDELWTVRSPSASRRGMWNAAREKLGFTAPRTLQAHAAKSFRFYQEFFELPDDTVLSGWWQSERFFTSIAELLRLHFSFRYPPSAEVLSLLEQIRSQPSVAVHLRRGDYVHGTVANRQHGLPGRAYYEQALQLLWAGEPGLRVFVFSDDVEAARREFQTSLPHQFVPAMSLYHAHDALRLMQACSYCVIANSSFSWWGAWLNREARRIVAPLPWFRASDHDEADIVPDAWTRVPACYEEAC